MGSGKQKAVQIWYHSKCPDGFTSAWVARKKFGNGAKYVPILHGYSPPDFPDGTEIYMIDCSFPYNTLIEIEKTAGMVMVLDHHKTSQEDLKNFPHTVFDMDRSGAMIAWNYFFPEQEPPDIVKYVQDRDLWLYKLPYSKQIALAMNAYSFKFEVWDELSDNFFNKMKEEGVIASKIVNQQVKSMCDNAQWMVIGEYRVPVTNATVFMSDVGNELCDRFPEAAFSAYYFDKKNGDRHWGLRSVGDFDVSEIAKQFGGGGHKNAAGFVESSQKHVGILYNR